MRALPQVLRLLTLILLLNGAAEAETNNPQKASKVSQHRAENDSSLAQSTGTSTSLTEADQLYQEGTQQFNAKQYQMAFESWQAALQIYQSLDSHENQIDTLNALGELFRTTRELQRAFDLHQQALDIAEEISDQRRIGSTLSELGIVSAISGQYSQAVSFYQRSLEINQSIENHEEEISTLINLGLAYHAMGQYEQAISVFEQTLALARSNDTIESRNQQTWIGNSLGGAALAYRELGQYEQAIDLFQQQISILQDLGNTYEQGRALGRLGIAYRESGQYEQAIETLGQRIAIAREVDDRSGEGSEFGNLGLAYDGLGQYEEAIAAYETRLVITRELNQRDRESLTLGNLAETYVSLGQIDQAIELFQQSLEISQDIGFKAQSDRVTSRLDTLYQAETRNPQVILDIDGILDSNSGTILRQYADSPETKHLSNSYQINGLANQTITISVESEGFTPHVVLIDAEENRAIANSLPRLILTDKALMIVTLPSDGTYTVLVSTQAENTQGSYRLKVTESNTEELLLSDATVLAIKASEEYQAENFQASLVLNQSSLDFYRSESVREAFPDLSRREEAAVLGNIGNAYDGLEDYEKSIDFQQQAIDLKRELENQAGEALSLTNLGNTYRRSGNYEQAIEAYQQAVTIWQVVGVLKEEINILDKLGDIYINQDNYDLAVEAYEQLFQVSETIGETPKEIATLRRIGVAYYRTGNHEKAIEYHQQALNIAQELDDIHEEAAALGNLGNVYNTLGDFRQAIRLHQNSLELLREIDDTKEQATALDNLGSRYFELGQYQQAINFYEEALSIARAGNHLDKESNTLNNIAWLYQTIGQTDQAIELYEQSLEISIQIGDQFGEALTSRNLAMVHPNFLEANKLLNRSLEIAQTLGDQRSLARAWSDLGSWYFRNPKITGVGENGTLLADFRYQETFEAFRKALTISRELGLRLEESQALRNLGQVYERTGDIAEAFNHFWESLEIARELNNPETEADVLLSLSSFYRSLNINNEDGSQAELIESLVKDAENFFLEALSNLDFLRGENLSEVNKVALFETQRDIYVTLQQVLLSQERIEEALVASERARARVLVESLTSQMLEKTEQEILNTIPDLDTIRKTAQTQNATLVNYAITGSTLHIWVVPPTGEIKYESVQLVSNTPQSRPVETETGKITFEPLPSEGESLQSLIADTRETFGVRGSRDRATVTIQYSSEYLAQLKARQNQRLSELHKLLIEPISEYLPDNPDEIVVFIPQDELFLVPFPALQDADGTHLIEKHTIVTAPSIQVLHITQDIAQSRPDQSIQKPIIVGNPTMPSVTFIEDSGNFKDIQLASLSGAQREAQTIANLLQTPALIGSEATEAAIKQELSDADLIHFATHGLLEYGDPRETGTRDTPGAIALTPGAGEDGLLTTREIQNMNLKANLVVLSACDTGRGRITGDGVIGLSRSFITAGVPSIVVSLWQVPDAPTADLMTEFYNQLSQGQEKAQALRQAMLITMQQNPDPKNWAAFTLIGNGI